MFAYAAEDPLSIWSTGESNIKGPTLCFYPLQVADAFQETAEGQFDHGKGVACSHYATPFFVHRKPSVPLQRFCMWREVHFYQSIPVFISSTYLWQPHYFLYSQRVTRMVLPSANLSPSAALSMPPLAAPAMLNSSLRLNETLNKNTSYFIRKNICNIAHRFR